MKLSIIIPHYNSEKKLIRLLKTIPDTQDIEVVVIDDHSNESIEKVLQYIENRHNISLSYNMHKKGAGGARNAGLDLANGEWIIFADADDYMEHGFFDIVKKYFNTDYQIIYFGTRSVDEKTGEPSNRSDSRQRYIETYLSNPSSDNLNKVIFKSQVPWGKMLKSSFVKNIDAKFDEIRVSDDCYFSMYTAVKAQKVTVEKKLIYVATKDSGTLSTTFSLENYEIGNEVIIRSSKLLQKELGIKTYKNLQIAYAPVLSYGLLVYRAPIRLIIKWFWKFNRAGISFITFDDFFYKVKKTLTFYKNEKKYK